MGEIFGESEKDPVPRGLKLSARVIGQLSTPKDRTSE